MADCDLRLLPCYYCVITMLAESLLVGIKNPQSIYSETRPDPVEMPQSLRRDNGTNGPMETSHRVSLISKTVGLKAASLHSQHPSNHLWMPACKKYISVETWKLPHLVQCGP